jgi:hypothetical protein
MLVVNVVQGEHGAAVEEKLVGEGLKAEVLEGDAQRRLGAAGEGDRVQGAGNRK